MKRYDTPLYSMIEKPDGDYVTYEEYVKLRERYDCNLALLQARTITVNSAREQVKNLQKQLDEYCQIAEQSQFGWQAAERIKRLQNNELI